MHEGGHEQPRVVLAREGWMRARTNNRESCSRARDSRGLSSRVRGSRVSCFALETTVCCALTLLQPRIVLMPESRVTLVGEGRARVGGLHSRGRVAVGWEGGTRMRKATENVLAS